MTSTPTLAVFDELVEGVVAFTDEGIFVYANRAALDVLGVESAVGRDASDFRSPRTASRVAAQWRRLRKEGHAAGEYEVLSADGRLTLVRFRSVANFQPGVHLLVMTLAEPVAPDAGVGRIGRRGTRADLFRSLFETDPDGLLVVDDERRYLDGNRAARSFLGISREDLRKRRLGEFTPEHVRREVDRLWGILLESGSVDGVVPVTLSTGIERTVHFHGRARITPGRHAIRFRLAAREQRTSVLRDGAPPTELTPRERQVLTLVARGASAEEIAADAVLSPETVRTHVRNAIKKLGARSRPHAVALAMRLREIDP